MKKLTTKINELKRKIAQKEAAVAKHSEKATAREAKNESLRYGSYWRSMAEGNQRDTQKLKAELCDLLLERVEELETEVAMFSKEYEVSQ
jgi:zona occludens toxin (predicted ATPase)